MGCSYYRCDACSVNFTYNLPCGEMFFGDINGFNAFYPQASKDNPHIPPIVITSFQKLNKEVKTEPLISFVKELTLSYRDYFFSFEFAALDYTRCGTRSGHLLSSLLPHYSEKPGGSRERNGIFDIMGLFMLKIKPEANLI